MDYMSKEFRFVNYVSLLFKNNSDLYDASGNLAKDASGNILLQQSIKNNEFFSDRLGLLPESYIFAGEYDTQKILLKEDKLHWNNQYTNQLWDGNVNIKELSDYIHEQRKALYNNAINSCGMISYFRNSFVKIACTNLIKVGTESNEKIIEVSSGFFLDTLLNQSLIVKGDNTISGNFFVNDSNNKNIFKVDNVKKTITNMYKVGIGMDEPNSILDIKDTTISDILSELDAGRQQYNLLNKIAAKLRDIGNNENTQFTTSTDYRSIINDVYTDISLNQTVDNYTNFYEINMDTMLADDVIVCSHWLYSAWDRNNIGSIQDAANKFSLNTLKTILTDILDKAMIYDNSLSLYFFQFVFGWKFSRILFLEIKGSMYLLAIGTNIQNYGLRPDSNTNITRFIQNGIRGNMTNNRIYTYMNNDTTVVNKVESFNELRRLNMEYEDIPMNHFILTIDTADINSTTIQDIYLFDRPPIPDSAVESLFNEFDIDGDGYLTGDEIDAFSQASGIPVGELKALALDLDSDNDNKISLNDIVIMYKPLVKSTTKLVNNFENYNIISKYKNLWIMFNNKKYYDHMSEQDFNVIYYEDLYSDYETGFKCIDISGSVFTLLCSELRIQDIIKPSLSVEGDAKITGDLLVTNISTGTNYVSIDPDHHFMGIGTDERFINYSDMTYSTTDSVYAGRHNVHVFGETYPLFVAERLIENANDTSNNDITKDDPRYFSTSSAMTSKRTSRLYTFEQMVAYAAELNKRMVPDNDKVTHLRYGTDVSFEICDKTERTVEIGNVQMVIDRIDENNNLRGGFSIQVSDPGDPGDTGRTFENSRRNLMYLDNDSTLFVKQIGLGGKVLSTDGSGNLLWGGKKLLTE